MPRPSPPSTRRRRRKTSPPTINGAAPAAMAGGLRRSGHSLRAYLHRLRVRRLRRDPACDRCANGALGVPMVAPSWRVKQGSSRQAVPMPSCARPGSSRPMARISSIRCCAWGLLAVICGWSTIRSEAPTPAADIAAACLKIAAHLAKHPEAAGIYHFAGAPDTSWAGFAVAIFEIAELAIVVEHIPTTEYPLPAAAPAELAARLFADRSRFRHQAPRLARGTGRDPQ